MMQTKKRNNINNNKLIALTLKEFIDKTIEDQDFIYGSQDSSSIVTNPPQNMDMQDDDVNDVEDDAENMSIQQIANSIEDSVITDTNSEKTQQQSITEAEMNEMIEETKQKIKENHPFRNTLAFANVLVSLEHQGRKRKL